ncbi:hypothetical protein BBD42_00765 [Paenibacillus sp. BIHB 4019]|uniref:Uncharacterized protein n=1 Tax=Paenibacillus sp. BIHB 4019 TaxID=1870819 RepID=A0A1B2DBT4_9BACL|nr:hypothetical protein BBD42_00765 [Paenibacillus sp. BIHB 4019]
MEKASGVKGLRWRSAAFAFASAFLPQRGIIQKNAEATATGIQTFYAATDLFHQASTTRS